MASNSTSVLCVTANVGSIFEEPILMLNTWVTEFLKTIRELQPQFVALHCQEIGGKNYEGSMVHVEDFVRRLLTSEELRHFDRIRVFLDEDFASSERFTALGNLYFIHESVKVAHIWDFKAKTFVPCYGKEVHSGNIEDVPSKEKIKFSPDFFPECKWSRKGYLHTRWSINGTSFDLINIHLFHDASNFLAIESFPSVYSNRRQRALRHVIDRLRKADSNFLPFFIFGDFNFRLDTQGVVKRLTHKSVPLQIKGSKNGEVSKIIYKEANNENKIVLTVGKKEFDHHEKHETFFADRGQWLREFDRELDDFRDQLFEYQINFPPSYPFVEDMNNATAYMKTRCPAWCDRILLNKSAKDRVIDFPIEKNKSSVQYEVVGESVCMGDHKPVYLFFRMKCDSGSRQLLPSDKEITDAAPDICSESFESSDSKLGTNARDESGPLLQQNVIIEQSELAEAEMRQNDPVMRGTHMGFISPSDKSPHRDPQNNAPSNHNILSSNGTKNLPSNENESTLSIDNNNSVSNEEIVDSTNLLQPMCSSAPDNSVALEKSEDEDFIPTPKHSLLTNKKESNLVLSSRSSTKQSCCPCCTKTSKCIIV